MELKEKAGIPAKNTIASLNPTQRIITYYLVLYVILSFITLVFDYFKGSDSIVRNIFLYLALTSLVIGCINVVADKIVKKASR